MSPGERGLDAIGLMKHINEQSADAYAEAREVLGNETPESILRARRFNNQNAESKSLGLHLASNVSVSPLFSPHRKTLPIFKLNLLLRLIFQEKLPRKI